MKNITKYLFTGQKVKGMAYTQAQLSAKFQVWCRRYGITESGSLALWLVNTNRATQYFNEINAKLLATEAAKKLPFNKEIIL
jgi:hypothetical protein